VDDLLHTPLYSIPECARYLGLPVSTVRRWVATPDSKASEHAKPLVQPAGSDPTALSFTNLVELHVLASLRRNRKMPLSEIRLKIDGLVRHGKANHPLVNSELLTYSRDQRVELDEAGRPRRYFPFTRAYGEEDPKLIVIDPMVRFGGPVIKGSGVSTSAIARYTKGGETTAELADDYGLSPEQIEEAVRYERVGRIYVLF
jgi:uncharacterized protein (DUF433 family)